MSTHNMQDIARDYIAQGWSVVPITKGKKKATSSFNKKTYTPHNFEPDDNIAGKCGGPSGWRVDVDCDAPEAVEAARHLLPETGLVHGRPGKPDSHYWFLADGAKTSQFTDVKDASGASQMIVEIRSTGGYTVLPPSIWTNKDGHDEQPLAWSINREPLTMTPEALYDAVRNVAIAALVARHWPASGVRHGMVGHLAGFLLRAGVDAVMVRQIIKAAAIVARDPDVQDRVNFAAATCAKHAAGEQVTGGPKLAESLGEGVVSRMRGWLKLADTDRLEWMNERHFWVRVGKDDCIGRETASGVIFQRPKSLYTEYANQRIVVGQDDKTGEPKLKPLFPHWLEWEHRRSYDEVVMAPPPLPCNARDYNLWNGLATQARAGDCSRILEHMHAVLCSGNDEHYRYLTKLCAALVQFPGLPWEIALVLRGQRGNGKGTFARLLGDIVGRRHFAHLDRVSDLVGFNAMISGKVVVFADEAFFAGDKSQIGTLQRLITEPTIRVTRKGIDSHEERNCIHLVMATNEDWSAPAGAHERRYFALNVSGRHAQDRAYFAPLYAQITSGGGVAAFVHEMQQVPVTPDDLREVPRTRELIQQQLLTMDAHLKWWFNCLTDGSIGHIPEPWGEKVSTDAVHQAFLAYVREQGVKRYPDKGEFAQHMSAYFTARLAKPATVPTRRGRCWEMRALADARATFNRLRGMDCEWSEVEPTESCIPF